MLFWPDNEGGLDKEFIKTVWIRDILETHNWPIITGTIGLNKFGKLTAPLALIL
jgi:hypothetical protein